MAWLFYHTLNSRFSLNIGTRFDENLSEKGMFSVSSCFKLGLHFRNLAEKKEKIVYFVLKIKRGAF